MVEECTVQWIDEWRKRKTFEDIPGAVERKEGEKRGVELGLKEDGGGRGIEGWSDEAGSEWRKSGEEDGLSIHA